MNTSRILALLLITLASGARAATLPASRPAQNSASAAGASFAPQFSAGGQHLVFISHANNLVTNDNLAPWLDVFVRDLSASNTVLASVNTSGIGGGNADAHSPSISSNGQFVAFVSRASNFVSGDTNNADDVFVRDLASATTHIVSVDVNGLSTADPNFALNIPLSGNPLISENGRWVVFESRATNLTATPAPLGSVNIYARDLWSNVTVLVSADTNGAPFSGTISLAGISASGTTVLFVASNASVLAPGADAPAQLFLRDITGGVTMCVSSNIAALLGNGASSSFASLSRDASSVAFLGNDTNGAHFPMFADLQAHSLVRLFAYGVSNSPSVMSADGSGVAFDVTTNNGVSRIYVWRRASGTLEVARENPGDFSGNATHPHALNADGRFIALTETSSSYFTNWTPRYQLFRQDTVGGSLDLVSANTNGAADSTSERNTAIVISPNGRFVAFDSIASDLVERDFNNANDIFLRDVNARATELISAAHTQRVSNVGVSFATLTPQSLSSNGQFIVFTRLDEPASFADTNSWPDVFLSDTVSGSTFSLSINTNPFVSPDGSALNTNAFASPIITADGRAVAALRRRSVLVNTPTLSDLVVARADSNGVFNTVFHDAAPLFGWDNGSPRVVGSSGSASFSGDGALMTFHSTSSPLTEYPDYNNFSDVFVRHFNRTGHFAYMNGTTNFIISKDTNGYVAATGLSTNPVFSPDGRWVAFFTSASNVVFTPSPTNLYRWGHSNFAFNALQLVAADLGTNRGHTNFLVRFTNQLCSYVLQSNYFDGSFPGAQPTVYLRPLTNEASAALFSADSRYVFFIERTSGAYYRHDLFGTHLTWYHRSDTNENPGPILTNFPAPGAPNLLACTNCTNATVSTDGELITFERLRAGTSNVFDVYARDLRDGSETLVSGSVSGALANGSSTTPLMSGDGRFVIFQSKAGDLIANDTNGFTDIFVRDRLLGVTMLVSANAQGRGANGPSTAPVLASDGRTVAFQSFANDLAPGDYNDKRDVFVLKLGSGDSDGDGLDDDWELVYFNTLARDGTGDADNDGINDRAEFLAGTDPTNGESIFRVLTLTAPGATTRNVIWFGNPARNYRVEFKDDVAAAGWTTLNAAPSWNGATATATDSNATNAQRFYRVVLLP
jgi:Tol biopolymer transport system component